MSKIYQLNSKLDFQKTAIATLKKVFSPTLFPRVLTNIQRQDFIKIFKKYAQICIFLPKNEQIFAKKTHLGNFDLGLFFFHQSNLSKKIILNLSDLTQEIENKTIYLKIFDGNGLPASSFVTNIFDDMFLCTDEQFEQKKQDVMDLYKGINKKKLLVQ